MSVPLLMTKLYIPLPGKYLVGRASLLDKLNQSLDPACRLTLISAPAGFGKTTLAAAWLSTLKSNAPDWQAAWLAVDERDNDPVVFWTYAIAALQTRLAGVGAQTLEMLAAQGGDLDRKLASLINDLVQTPRPCVLVVDDFHLIRSPSIHQSLAFFIEHAPAHIHLILASRTDPPLPLALMRGRGQLLEIRLSDLRFSDEDAESYLNGGVGLNLAEQSVRTLNQKTEGWIAGLQMAALAMRDIPQPVDTPRPGTENGAGFVASFSGSNRFILDYLIEEVLNRQPEAIQQFLVQTSILEQLCGPLCDALLQGGGTAGQPDAQSALQYLESSNLFIVPLDQQRYWYRYHHLFGDLLRKRLSQSTPESIPELHRRAIQWYEENGLIPSAIQHAFQLGDFQKAAALVAQITEELWGRGEHATLLAWMDALPEDAKLNYPHLLTFQVSMLISAGRLQEAEACIPILERYIQVSLQANPDQTALIGNVSALRTYIASFYGDRAGVYAHARVALQNLTREEDAGQRCGVSLVLGNAYLNDGDLEAASRVIGGAIADGKKAHKPHMAITGISNLAEVLYLQGQLNRAAQVCQEGLQLVEQHSLERAPMAASVWIAWGAILCERGALAEAETFIQRGLDLAREQQFVWQAAWGHQMMARLLLAKGSLADAESAAQAGVQWSEAHQVPAHIACPISGVLVEVWLRQGKIAQAERYLQSKQIETDGEIQFPRQSEYLALARLALLRGDAGAAGVLERIFRWAEEHQYLDTMIAALILLAEVNYSPENPQASLGFLEQAMTLAEPQGYARIFVNEGAVMESLLRAAYERDIAPDFAGRLLQAFPEPIDDSGKDRIAKGEAVERRPASAEQSELIEPLSRREMETLQLIAEGYSNKEIAQRLFISLRTVKYYSTGLYNKLGVDGRMQAVIRARELGLL